MHSCLNVEHGEKQSYHPSNINIVELIISASHSDGNIITTPIAVKL
jgi:hypothetical protein